MLRGYPTKFAFLSKHGKSVIFYYLKQSCFLLLLQESSAKPKHESLFAGYTVDVRDKPISSDFCFT